MTENQNVVSFPMMEKYLRPLKNPGKRPMVGRDDIIKLVEATLNRDEISNVALIGEAGTGKTTVAYGVADQDKKRYYYEVRLALMSSSDGGIDGSTQMATRLTQLIDEVTAYQQYTNREMVLFMDEFHLIMEISPAAVEAIKPILANSGARGIKIIVATTYEEYNKYVRPNEALNERLERISLPELSFEETLSALHGSMETHLPGVYVSDNLLRRLIDVTNQALPSQKQPRKALRILDAMSGWYKTFGGKFDDDLLAQTMKASVGVDIKYQVDVDDIVHHLNQRVFDQSLAVRAVTDRLYISVAGLNAEKRPRGSFLFTGSTGVGKTELAKALAGVMTGDDDHMIRFDMSEYSQSESVTNLRMALTTAIWEYPSSVILMDEIEKAAPECAKLMLQVLDDARLTDEHGKQASFEDAFLIFTTNGGASVYSQLQEMYGHGMDAALSDEKEQMLQRRMLRDYLPLIKQSLQVDKQFPPELLGRFDAIVPFAPLGEITRYKICDLKFKKIAKMVYQKHGVTLHFDKEVRRYIVEEHAGSNQAENGGGREINRKIDENLVSRLSEVLIKYPNVPDLAVWVQGQMALDNPNDREGQAQIQVGRWNGES